MVPFFLVFNLWSLVYGLWSLVCGLLNYFFYTLCEFFFCKSFEHYVLRQINKAVYLKDTYNVRIYIYFNMCIISITNFSSFSESRTYANRFPYLLIDR